MSKIFRISGNFLENGEWAQPDPSFTGEIVVDDDNTFHGYCNELYDGDTPDLNKTRYLAGAIATNNETDKEGIVFFKLSNYIEQTPLLYLISGEEGVWGIIFPWRGDYFMIDKARVKIEEVTYDLKDEQRIENKFNELDKSINLHDQLLLPEQMQSLIDIFLTNAK